MELYGKKWDCIFRDELITVRDLVGKEMLDSTSSSCCRVLG
jgi:hypothetical protein